MSREWVRHARTGKVLVYTLLDPIYKLCRDPRVVRFCTESGLDLNEVDFLQDYDDLHYRYLRNSCLPRKYPPALYIYGADTVLERYGDYEEMISEIEYVKGVVTFLYLDPRYEEV